MELAREHERSLSDRENMAAGVESSHERDLDFIRGQHERELKAMESRLAASQDMNEVGNDVVLDSGLWQC